ncbi:MAG: SbmA/BacA-like family transporter [Pseudolabrys sp.]
MSLTRQFALILDRKQLLARFWKSTRQVWQAKRAWAISLATFLIGVLLLQLVVQVLLNLWNRNFFDALERKDAHALWVQAQMFVPLAAVSILLAAASVWGRMTAQRGWREGMSRHVINRWLDKDRFYRLNHLANGNNHSAKGSENPEYRIAVDIRVATDAPIDLTLAFVSSILTALTFFGVLWTVGGSLEVPVFGTTVTIPGYLVLGVIVYSSVMSALMILVGHHLTGVIERTNQSEAELRASIDAFREQDPAHPGRRPDGEKRRTLWLSLQAVLLWWREFLWQLVRTTLVSHGNFLLAPVVAWLLCVPKYLSGAMTLGELTQTAAAFVTVQGAFNWLVDNYQRLADWRSSAHRVATLLNALDDLETDEEKEEAQAPGAVTPLRVPTL